MDVIFFYLAIFVRGGHYDYSSRAPKDLATQLSTILRKSQWVLYQTSCLSSSFTRLIWTTKQLGVTFTCLLLISQRSLPTVSVNAPRGFRCRNVTVCKRPKQSIAISAHSACLRNNLQRTVDCLLLGASHAASLLFSRLGHTRLRVLVIFWNSSNYFKVVHSVPYFRSM